MPQVRPLSLVLLVLATVWVVLLVAAPLMAPGVRTSAAVYAFGAFICHQRPERSFHLAGAQLPVCARCFGLYAGAAAGAIAAWFIVAQPVERARLRRMLMLGAIPTAVTWVLEVIGVAAFSNAIRFLAALPLGSAVALTVNYVECARPPRNVSGRPPTPI